MSGWWKSLPNGLPNVVSPPKSGHRRAAKGMEFPWRCNVDTIAMDLKVSWEMSDNALIGRGTLGAAPAHSGPVPGLAVAARRRDLAKGADDALDYREAGRQHQQIDHVGQHA